MNGFVLRTYAMAAKEALHIRRDPRTLYMALAMPVVMLLLFGFGIAFDVRKNPLVVVDHDASTASRRLIRAFTENEEFAQVPLDQDVDSTLRKGLATAALVIPQNYERELLSGKDVRVQILVDGVDGNTARYILAKADAIVRAESQRRQEQTTPLPPRVTLATLYNPTGDSAWFIVPGLAAYLLAISAVLLTALTIAGEWERGSMEQLFASPLGRLEIVLGKLLPYLVLGMGQLMLVIFLGTTVFHVPIQGSLVTLFLAGFLFLIGMLGQGLLISVVTRNQLVATQAGALSSLLPSLILSGMIVPIESMPWALQTLSRVVPARYLVHAFRSLMLKGAGFASLGMDILALTIFAVVVLVLSTLRFKRRLAT
jgi:ABC-2 type transport system permease protein